jgi:hypothetical protein
VHCAGFCCSAIRFEIGCSRLLGLVLLLLLLLLLSPSRPLVLIPSRPLRFRFRRRCRIRFRLCLLHFSLTHRRQILLNAQCECIDLILTQAMLMTEMLRQLQRINIATHVQIHRFTAV